MATRARIQQLRATAAEWTQQNPVLRAGEIGVETDTGFAKVGNGATPWTGRPYWAGPPGRGYTGVEIDGDELVFASTDGTDDRITPPQIAAAQTAATNAAQSAGDAADAEASAEYWAGQAAETVAAGVADATTEAKGKLQLAGDLAGTASAPTVPGLTGKIARAGGAVTLWGGTEAQYAALPAATKNAAGFIAVIVP